MINNYWYNREDFTTGITFGFGFLHSFYLFFYQTLLFLNNSLLAWYAYLQLLLCTLMAVHIHIILVFSLLTNVSEYF